MRQLTLIWILGILAVSPARGEAQIYWTNIMPGTSGNGSIMRANADGTGVETLVAGLSHPRGMALDVSGGKMYWTEPGVLAVRRANLDGSNVETVVSGAQNGTSGVALDVVSGKMYWTESIATPTGGVDGKIHRANLDGSDSEELLIPGLVHPVGIALDALHGRMYWTDLDGHHDGTGTIKRANLDGSGVENLLSGVDEAHGLALDVLDGKMYWTEIASHSVYRANLDGSDATTLVSGLEMPTTINLDLVARMMYWTNAWDGGLNNMIQCASLDGSGVETFLAGGLPWGITVTPEPATFSLLVLGGLAVMRRRCRIVH